MENVFTSVLLAVTTFALTNIDDLMILSMYFANPDYKKNHVVVGQYLGVMTLVLISLTGLILGKVLEPMWIGLLGLIPVILGIKGLISLFNSAKEEGTTEDSKAKPGLQFLNVAVVTIANGGDNLGVYTPLFASSSFQTVVLFIIVFLIMITVWCLLAVYFVKHAFIKNLFARYGHVILPVFLIVLGIWIMVESESLALIF